MTIIQSSDTYLRHFVINYLESLKFKYKEVSVLDIGGAANPWCDEYVTTYIDIEKVNTKKEVIIGNILDNDLWISLRNRSWHFAICSHVLEDIRDPLFLIQWIQKVAQAGFIAVPNKHTELSPIESLHFPGYHHHRWIFTLQGEVLRAMAKLPLLGYYRKTNRWLRRLFPRGLRGTFLTRVVHSLFSPGAIPAAGTVPWYDPSKARQDYELSFVWEGRFDFEYINDDYYGPGRYTAERLFLEELGTGL